MLPPARLCRAALGAASVMVLSAGAQAGVEIAYHEFSGSLGLESRWYPDDAVHPGQRSYASGFVAEPRFYLEDAEGRSLTLAPFLRYDAADPRRTHADLHEAFLLLFGEFGDGEWELRAGVDRVFWGVAESHHLVDVVNQIDLVEHPNEEAKLGQPMVHATWSGDWGVAEVFALPYHRKRTFPGRRGRLRLPFVVDESRTSYESAAEQWHLDLAARYSHSFGPVDFGLSAFDGTNREPLLLPVQEAGSGASILVPHYEQIRQLGLDAQLTAGSWLFKLEALRRTGARNRLGREEGYAAIVLGGEYTFYSVLGSAADFSLLGEWNHDARGRGATDKFENDLFLAARPALNDMQSTEILASGLWDLDYATSALTIELKRRLSDQWSLHLETVALLDVDEADLLYETRRDSFVALDLSYHF